MAKFGDKNSADAFNNNSNNVRIDAGGMDLGELLFTPTVRGDGLAFDKGPLLVALEKNQNVTIENFARSKPGTASSVQQLFMFLTGEVPSVVIYHPLGGDSVTLERGKVTSSVTIADFDKLRNDDSNLPNSLHSRISKPTFGPGT